MKHIIKQEKWASIKSKLLKTTFESLVTVYSKTGRIPHHYKPNYVIKQYVEMLTKRQYSDYLLQTTTDYTLVLHCNKLTVFNQSLLNAQPLKYITLALSLSLALNP